MPDEIILPSDNAPADSPAPTSAPPPPVPPADEYKNRFTGLQKVIDDLYKRTGYHSLNEIPAKPVVDQAQAAVSELTQLRTSHEELGTQLQGISSERDALRAQVAEKDKLLRKANFIASKAPHLAPFMDFIPAADDDEGQLAVLEEFQRRMKQTGVTPAGALPPASSPPVAAANSGNPGALIREMNAATAAKDWVRLNELQKQWDAIGS